LPDSLVENYLRQKPDKEGIAVLDLASSQVWRDLLGHSSTFHNSALNPVIEGKSLVIQAPREPTTP